MSDESSNDKETVPPPPGVELDEHEETVVSARPDELLAELARAAQPRPADQEEPAVPPSGKPGPTSEGGGLRQMFARNPMHIRDVLPTEAEGDALLDMLFDDATTVAPSQRETEVDDDEAQPTQMREAPSFRPASDPGAEVDLGGASAAFDPHQLERPTRAVDRVSLPRLTDETLDEEDAEEAAGAQAPAPPRPPPPPVPRPAPPPMAPPALARDEDASEPPAASATSDDIDFEEAEEAPPPPPPPPLQRAVTELAMEAAPEALLGGDAAFGVDLASPEEEAAAAGREEPDVAADDEGFVEPEPAAASVPPPSVAPPRPSGRPRAGLPSMDLGPDRDASLVLAETRSRDVFAERAEWLLEEARLVEDAAARAQQLVVVSELLAMCGEDERALEIAAEAMAAHPTAPLAARQRRALLAKRGDFTAVLEAVDAETRHMPTAEARGHGSWLGAEIARVVLGDEAGARRRAEQAMRVVPGDPRPHVQRVVDAMSGRAEKATPLGKVRPMGASEIPSLQTLDEACVHAARHRREPVRGDEAIPVTPFEALLDARAALEGDQRLAAVTALEALAQGPLAGAMWTVGFLADADAETQERAAGAFQAVASGSHGAFARRALAASAIARDDAAAAYQATVGDGSFDLADRLALAALAGAPVGTLTRDLEAAAADPDLAPLAVAAAAALPAEGGLRPELAGLGSPRARAAIRLGRRLGQGSAPSPGETDAFRDAATELAAHAPGGVATALGIELDLLDRRAASVARALESWGADAGVGPLLAAGLVAEVAGDVEAARGAYERAATSEVQHEGAVRALAAHLDPTEVPALLAEHAAALGDGPRPALHFVEAALRLLQLGAETEAETVLGRAAVAAPGLPFSAHLLERQARARGDRDALLDTIRNRRDASDDAVERAHDFVREALLVSDTEGSSPDSLLEQALSGQPDDVALRELYERLAAEPPSDRAAWREQRAARATGQEATSLALEAALDMERAGDVAGAARAVKLASERAEGAPADGDPLLLPIYAHRYGVAGHGAAELVDTLLPAARAAEDPHQRREIYEQLAELDELGRGDVASGVLWRRTILEEDPSHLPTLRRIETALMSENRIDELEPIALGIARTLATGPEAIAHAALSARLRMRTAWDEAIEPVRIAYATQPRGPWVLRQMSAHARAQGDTALALEIDRQLLVRTERPGEVAALALRAARGAAALGDEPLATSMYEEAAKAMPTHLLARLELAGALEAQGDQAGAAAQLEAAAECATTTSWKIALDHEAAILWQDQAGDRDRARAALERIIALEPTHEQAFERLRGIYVAIDARAELAELLERRLDAITDPGERVEMEVMRGRALAQVGEHASAKRALAAALEASPDHVDALEAFAELCVVDEDWDGAEQALIRLARLAQGPDKAIEAYLRLGDLYETHLPNAERAELAYGEVLKRRPGHAGARERLVALFKREGQFGRAIEEQNVLVASAEQPEDKARRTVELASIVEAMGDVKKAEATLVAARKAFPKSSVALEALVALYQRTGQQQAGAMLLDRAVADARRALGTGRFEGYLFETLAVAAGLRGKRDAALACRSVVEALEGAPDGAEPIDVRGVGERAGDPDLDDLVAPDLLSPAFRDLLARTGAMLDTAVPYDPASVRATPLPPPSASLAEEIRDIAIGYGIHRLEILSSSVLGSVCVAASAHPPTLVLGQPLLSPDAAPIRTYLVHRALKVIQANAAVFSRTAPIDLWPLLAAYLKCFTPGWNPQGVDATRLTNFYGRLSRAVPPGLPHDTSAIAQEIIGTIGNRAPTLATAVNGWGDRCALLACASPSTALTAIAWAGGHTNAPPAPGKDRLVWVGRNAEAREMILFAVSDAYVEARNRLGLGD